MATAKVKQFWTAFISVLFALLASVGLAGTAAAAQQPAVQQPEEPAAGPAATPAAAGERATASVPAQRAHRLPPAGDRSLPPTIKQRIAAEAHGSSPASRNRSTAGVPVAADHDEPAALTEPALAAAA
ncbi:MULTISPECIES: DUF6344 domain-containing protein [unclassified Streptomyces]|uniref:DUF6344 domain-containing protein n=1 Tax=unclassified Streptomyces TaxID=2593676 RepID=UPI000700CE74|nr:MULTISPECIES: DUF6344 domain-containing protein [unclassified Streptomyces]KQX49489.1 hypothetical protein ASD33_17275 [Streptomyces sp. Root1304]KRA79108.1 hypothetical protein ASE09_21795 [Streptomyces sp. Root66D1]